MKRLLFGIIVIIMTGTILAAYYEEDTLKIEEPTGQPLDILFEESYSNAAYGYQYDGYVICRDGSVYSFDMGKDSVTTQREDYSGGLQGTNEWILSNSKLHEDVKVSEKDLKKMIKYSTYIDASKHSKEKHTAYDAGSHSTAMYDYENNVKISLNRTGDFTSRNTSPYAKDLVKLIEKYTAKARTENIQERK